ncbi:MAG: hypothetical protein IKD68_05215 [Solobacterium sp.]|nr:hypothetical protein [Solobacterium sp.]
MAEEFSRTIRINASSCDRFQRLRMSALFSILQEMSISDVEGIGVTREMTLDKGLLWVISRMKLEFERMISYDEEITFSTWPGERSHMMFPRYYEARDAEGNLVFRGSSLWLLISESTRTIIRPEDYGIEIPAREGKEQCELPMALRSIDSDRPASIRTVLYSDIDLNGHVNNTRYLDWIDDLFDVHFHEVYVPTAVQINYDHEVEYGSSVSLHYEYGEQIYRIDGKLGDHAAFRARFEVKKA